MVTLNRWYTHGWLHVVINCNVHTRLATRCH